MADEDVKSVRELVRRILSEELSAALLRAGISPPSQEPNGAGGEDSPRTTLTEGDGTGPEPLPPNGGKGGNANPSNATAEDSDPAGSGEPSPACVFLGFLAQDGTLRLMPEDPEACRQVVDRLPPAKRRFLRDKGLSEKAEDENE